jgi:hypothetical protein
MTLEHLEFLEQQIGNSTKSEPICSIRTRMLFSG